MNANFRHLILVVKTNQEMVFHWKMRKQIITVHQGVSADDFNINMFTFFVYNYTYFIFFHKINDALIYY